MNGKIRPTVWLTAIVVIVVIIGIVVGIKACSSEDSTELATDSHANFDPVGGNPSTAATMALTAILSYTPMSQDTPFDQYAAVRDNLTGKIGQVADNPPVGAQDRKTWPRQWEAWRRGGDAVAAYVLVRGNPGDPGAEATETTIPVTVTQRVNHPDGDVTPLTTFDAVATVRLEAGRWKLADYTITEVTS